MIIEPLHRFLDTLDWRTVLTPDGRRLRPVSHTLAQGSVDADIRTEDIAFSPGGGRLALTATDGIIHLFRIDTQARPLHLAHLVSLRGGALSAPHGVAFLREDIIAVANRGASVTFHRIPDDSRPGDTVEAKPLHVLQSGRFGKPGEKRDLRGRLVHTGPGSIRIHGDELFVCCNYKNTVTAHRFSLNGDRVETGSERLVAHSCIEIPDGVALSRDGRWMAVSDHDHSRVLIYAAGETAPCGALQDSTLLHPHGLCFTADGQCLYVADAGGRYIHVFTAPDGWRSDAHASTHRQLAVGAAAFRMTRDDTPREFRALEGGAKGLDIDPSGRILAITCRHQILRFFETARA